MPLTYGDLPIMVPLDDIQEWVEYKMRPQEMRDFECPVWPQHGQEHIHFRSLMPQPFRLNCLRWPVGASVWSLSASLTGQADAIGRGHVEMSFSSVATR
jgi:hypothetical protein